MTDLSKLDIEFYCGGIGSVQAWSSKLDVGLENVDTTEFIDEYQDEILEHIGEDEVGKWLESQGYRVEAE